MGLGEGRGEGGAGIVGEWSPARWAVTPEGGGRRWVGGKRPHEEKQGGHAQLGGRGKRKEKEGKRKRKRGKKKERKENEV